MAKRKSLTVRLDVDFYRCVKATAVSLRKSMRYVIEIALSETFKHSLPPGKQVEGRVEGEDSEG